MFGRLKQTIGSRKNISDNMGFLLIVFIFILFLWTIIRFTSSMPIMDDYGAVLNFLNKFTVALPTEKLSLLFEQHSEHRIVFNRIVELTQFKLYGEVNFLQLVLIGNLGWILTLYLLWRYAKIHDSVSVTSFVPVVLLMLTFSHSALMTWAMAALQQYWQLFFALLAIYFMTEGKHYKALSFMVTAIFTSGGGLTLVPLFLLYYLVYKNWKYLSVSFVVSIVVLFIYFKVLGFQKSAHGPDILSVLIHNTKIVFLYMLTFLGNLGETVKVSIYVGGILVLLYIVKIKAFFLKVPFIAWSILFILMTSALTALSRSAAGPEQALSSRYAIYSVLFVSLIYLGYSSIYKHNKTITVIGFIVGISSFIFYFVTTMPAFESRKYDAETKLAFPSFSDANTLLKRSEELKVFKPDYKVKPKSVLFNVPKLNGKNDYCIGISKQIRVCNGKATHYMSGEVIPLMINMFEQETTLSLDGWTIDSIHKNKSYGVVVFIGHLKKFFYLNKDTSLPVPHNESIYAYSRLDGRIPVSKLAAGEYLLEVRTLNNEGTGYYETSKIPVHVLRMEEMDSLEIQSVPLKGHTGLSRIKGKTLISGWYVNEKEFIRPSSIVIEIDNKKYFAKDGISRLDVARALDNPRYKRSGFKFEIKDDILGKGKHSARVFILANDRSVLYDTNVQFEFEVK